MSSVHTAKPFLLLTMPYWKVCRSASRCRMPGVHQHAAVTFGHSHTYLTAGHRFIVPPFSQLPTTDFCSLLRRCSTTMSSESPVVSHRRLFSFCGLFKGILVKASRPSVLLPVLRLVQQASPAFPPLQSAVGGLLNVIELMEVWHSFSP